MDLRTYITFGYSEFNHRLGQGSFGEWNKPNIQCFLELLWSMPHWLSYRTNRVQFTGFLGGKELASPWVAFEKVVSDYWPKEALTLSNVSFPRNSEYQNSMEQVDYNPDVWILHTPRKPFIYSYPEKIYWAYFTTVRSSLFLCTEMISSRSHSLLMRKYYRLHSCFAMH